MKQLQALSLEYSNNCLKILDQQMLPDQEDWITVEGPDHMVAIIKALKVRGAPLIGVAAALSLADYAEKGASESDFLLAAKNLRESRPTAVNLMLAVDAILEAARGFDVAAIVECAEKIFDKDVELCQQMGRAGAELVADGDVILTHCNTGGLATVGIGTALGVINSANQSGKSISVFVDETRPLLQGGRLTTWELKKLSIPYTLICDNMAGHLMAEGRISKVFLGSDRIARNGDFANKIGTYSVAVLAHFHRVPFYVVAPSTTVDMEIETGADIPIEQRKPSEVQGVEGSFGQVRWSPEDASVYNPAFDVTPAELITGFVIDDKYITSAAAAEGAIVKHVQGV